MNKEAFAQDVGVVVIGRNEGELLVRCLQSLAGYRENLVYVDSGSTDASVAEATAIGARVVKLDPSIPFTAARARNSGAEALLQQKGLAYIQFVDGDCQVNPAWIGTARQYLIDHPAVAAVGGRLRERSPQRSIYNQLCDIEWHTAVGEVTALGGIAMYRLVDFLAVGRFDPAIRAGEEPELCLRLRLAGHKIVRLADDMATHDADITTFTKWWRRSCRAGYGGLDLFNRLVGKIPEVDIPYYHALRSVKIWTTYWLVGTLLLAVFGGIFFRTGGALAGLCLGSAVWLVQALRVGYGIRNRAPDIKTALAYGFFNLLGKWAQLAGQREYLREVKMTGGGQGTIARQEHITLFQADRQRYPARAFLREQSLWAIAVYRFGRRNTLRTPGVSKWFFERLYWGFYRIIETLTGISFTKDVTIGPGLRIHHFGNIFIHPQVRIGANCTLRQGVTIGNRVEGGPVPEVDDDVDFGAYAQVLGGVKIGKGAKIGAMSVVLTDVPANATAVGIPARIIHSKDKQAVGVS